MPDHPQRPQRPGRAIPLRGDDNTAWLAWRNQCQACWWAEGKHDCGRHGTVVYASGRSGSMFKQAPGGCSGWRPRDE